ncbi:hypothetical protein FPOA_03534 [Fusarium poae]|uniref:Uncharacterized protein n=1 Tax=Fusarium poae TaxID=36050 RepID=A0A1B8BA37_FUSPO|nr:hypothetical protein FPOA_03534 [Fusarium poae]
MSQDAKDLQIMLAQQAERDNDPSTTSHVVSEIKSSLIVDASWEQLLQASPIAISGIGACFIASSSPKAAVQLTSPQKGFSYLRYASVQANLIECGNMGRFAFIEAESKMGHMQMISQAVHGKISDIIPTIGDAYSAKKMLRPQVQHLSRSAQTCLEASIGMDKKFTEWLLYVCELHAACVQHEGTDSEELLSNDICLIAESTRLDYKNSSMEEARRAQDLVGKQVTAASEVFKKVSDEVPTGWSIMSRQIVSDSAGSVTSALNASIPTLMNSLSPMANLPAKADLVGGFLNPDKNTSGEGVAAPPSPIPTKATDPGYSGIQNISVFLSILQVIVAGQNDGGINWEMAKYIESRKRGATSAIKVVTTMLRDAKQRFTPLATSEEPSQTLLQILDVSLRVAEELQAVVEKSSYLAKDSAEVKKWQADLSTVYSRATALLATAKTIPGTVANGIPLMADVPNRFQKEDPKSAQAPAMLEAAKNRLTIAAHMLKATQDNYVKTNDVLSQQQNKLAEIQAMLAKLSSPNVSFAEIKQILIESIKLIIHIKDQINSLVRFFKAIGVVVEIFDKCHVEPFIETIKVMMTEGEDPNENYRIGDYTLTDLQRSQVYSGVLTLSSYFSAFGNIAKMWVTLSRDMVMPGVMMCDEISMATSERDPGVMLNKFRRLSQWSQEASARVKSTAGNKQREMMQGMQSRIEDIEQTTKAISKPSDSTLKAIESGIQVTKQAAQNNIEQRAKNSALVRFRS